MKKKFKLENYQGNYIMCCKTEGQCKKFDNFLHKNGRCLANGDLYTTQIYHIRKDEYLYYYFNEGLWELVRSEEHKRGWNEMVSGYTILEFEDFDWDGLVFEIQVNDILTFRNGKRAMVYQYKDELICAHSNGWNYIGAYNNDLTAYVDFKVTKDDIVKIQRPMNESDFSQNNWDKVPVVWERKETKTWNGMTYEEAHRKMWRWLAEHPGKGKKDWFVSHNYSIDGLLNECFACQLAIEHTTDQGDLCDNCPLNYKVIGCGCGLYGTWRNLMKLKEFDIACQVAKIIAELPWNEVE